MTDDNCYHNFTDDGFGRLVKIKNQSSSLVEQFWYDGLGQRISWKYDTNSDGRVDGSDKKYHFAYDERWRLAMMVFREADTFPKEEHFYYAAGLDGQGGSSYIDSEVLRDKDDNNSGGWTSAPDGTLEQRPLVEGYACPFLFSGRVFYCRQFRGRRKPLDRCECVYRDRRWRTYYATFTISYLWIGMVAR